MTTRNFALAALLALMATPSAGQQVFSPGTLFVDGWGPIVCGMNTFVLTTAIPDAGINTGRGVIYLNPAYLGNLPTVLKLYVVGHECGHSVVGPNEAAADCWSVQTGRDQGWFPPDAFDDLAAMLANNPGDFLHPSGPRRYDLMVQCYNR